MSNTSGDVNDALDAALELTFPASDPIAVFIRDYDAWDGAVTHVERTARTSIARDEGVGQSSHCDFGRDSCGAFASRRRPSRIWPNIRARQGHGDTRHDTHRDVEG